MQTFKIQIHIKNTTYDQPHFFILSKGLNAGRPSANPYTHSHVVIANDEVEKRILFWICFALWKSNQFIVESGDSVPAGLNASITAIHLNRICLKLANRPELFLSDVREIKSLIKAENLLNAQLRMIKRIKKALAKRMLKGD